MKHYIIGHQKPDLDSVAAAISLAEFFSQVGDQTGTPVIAGPINLETEYIFKKFNATVPPIIIAKDIAPKDKILLVDHNEEGQRLAGINPDQISGIVDHHSINLHLNHPVSISIKTWGSTNTVIYFKFKLHDLTISKQLAELMLAAILSDTVGLKSATTTDKDREAIKNLQTISQINDIDTLTQEIFKAKSNISTLSPEQIVKNDYKIFDFPKKTFIGQLETVEQDKVLKNMKQDLLKAMQEVKQQEKVELLFLAISDVIKTNTKLLILGDSEKQVAEKAFGETTQDNVLDIGAKLSRKKQIAPPIEKALS